VPFSALLDQFAREYLPTRAPGTQRSYLDSLKPIRGYFVEQLKDPDVEAIRGRDISAFLEWRRANRRDGDAPVANRTLQKDRAVLHRIFRLAEDLEYRDGNPVARVEPPKADRRAQCCCRRWSSSDS
jgi:site-specific recombinase XerD